MNFSIYFKICSYIPFINLLLLLVLILHVYFLYGHLPTYSNPDPKTLTFTYNLYFISELLLIFSFFIYPILIVLVIYKKLKIIKVFKYIVIYGVSLILLLVLYRIESLDLGNWILD